MKNSDVVKAFLNKQKAKTKNLWTDGDVLVNYSTVIACHNAWIKNLNQHVASEATPEVAFTVYPGLYIDVSKYSVSTGRIQSNLRAQALQTLGNNYKVVVYKKSGKFGQNKLDLLGATTTVVEGNV